MYRRKSRRCCAAMLIVSVCLRLCMFLGLDTQLAELTMQVMESPKTAQFLLFLQTGSRPEIIEPTPTVLTVEVAEPQPTPVPISVVRHEDMSAAPAEELSVAGRCSYSYDKQALLAQPTTLDFSGTGPHVLILHTHGTEAYDPSDGLTYEATTAYRTLDADRSVMAVGTALTEALEQMGIGVIHDTTVFDYPNYNTSYWNALQNIEYWQNQYPDLQLILDIHRDAVEDDEGNAVALVSRQEDVSAAKIMVVVGTDEGGLEHPNWQENLANALKFQALLQGQYPGLCRNLDLRTERFNQHTAPGALLIEVGTNGNTLTQALATVPFLAKAIGELIYQAS